MKTIVEYGVRAGAYAQIILPSIKKGQELAKDLAWVFSDCGVHLAGMMPYWQVSKDKPRVTWQSDTHFVALSLLDGVPRGPVTSEMYKLP